MNKTPLENKAFKPEKSEKKVHEIYTTKEVQEHARKQGLTYREAKSKLFDVK